MPAPLMELAVSYGSLWAIRPQLSLRLEKVSKVLTPIESKLIIGGRVLQPTGLPEREGTCQKGGELPDGFYLAIEQAPLAHSSRCVWFCSF